jgi:hypothetical protein
MPVMFFKLLISITIFLSLISSSCRKNEDVNNPGIDSLWVSLPDAFSPDYNGPPVNNTYFITYDYGYHSPYGFVRGTNDPVKGFQMQIRDQNNNLIFSTSDIKHGWNGMYGEKHMPVGEYFVWCRFEGKYGGSAVYTKTIKLVR